MFILRNILTPLQNEFSTTALGRQRSRWFVYVLVQSSSVAGIESQMPALLYSITIRRVFVFLIDYWRYTYGATAAGCQSILRLRLYNYFILKFHRNYTM